MLMGCQSNRRHSLIGVQLLVTCVRLIAVLHGAMDQGKLGNSVARFFVQLTKNGGKYTK
jgi:hypothetical protein